MTYPLPFLVLLPTLPRLKHLFIFTVLSFRMPALVSQQFKFRTPFTRRWDTLPRHVYDTLVDEGFSPRQSDGELLALFCLRPRRHPDIDREFLIEGTRLSHLFQDPDSKLATAQFIPSDYLMDMVAAALGRLPQPISPDLATETWLEFHRLLEAVGAGKPSHLLTPLQTQWDHEDMTRWALRDDPPPLLQPELKKWRHWKPRDLKDDEPTTQRALEVHLRSRWADRLLAHFAPYAEHVPHMAAIMGPDFHQEMGHLLGDARFRTLRQHCLAYEALRKKGFTSIPWKENDVRSLLNTLAAAEVTPYKLQQVWSTLRWLSKIFGLLNVDEIYRLKTKKQALEETLADTATKPQRKAVVPSKEVVWALEEGASALAATGAPGPDPQTVPGVERHKMMDAFILAIARFQLGCSARFNDLQHVHPGDIHSTTETIELQAWQTKTVSAAKIRKHPVPLICPKYSFSGKDWWSGLVSTIRKLSKEEQFKQMDFLIPTVSKDFNGVICRPSTPDRGLRWLKDAIIRQGVARDHVDPSTWHSFRVFMPDCAFQIGLPRTQRQYLGNWLSESTADVYIREKRNVVVSIWNKVAAKVSTLNMKSGRERREDLQHPDWDEPVMDLEAAQPTDGDNTSPSKSASSPWSVVGNEKESPPPRVLFKTQAPSDLRVIASRTRTSATGQFRVHLLNMEGTAVGCGWKPKSSSVEDLNPDDFYNDLNAYGKCVRCFKAYDLPSDFVGNHQEVTEAPMDTDSSRDSGSDTDDSVDTESDKENICLPI